MMDADGDWDWGRMHTYIHTYASQSIIVLLIYLNAILSHIVSIKLMQCNALQCIADRAVV